MRVRHRQRGFTLIEVLVAVTVFAVLAVLAHQGLRSALDTRAHLEARADRLAALQLTVATLARDIEQAVPRAVRDELGDREPALRTGQSRDRRLELTRGGWLNPTGQARSELQRVAYGLRDDRLIRWHWTALDRAPGAEPTNAGMLDGVRSLELRFLDQDGEWREDWPPPGAEAVGAALPRAVEVVIDTEDLGRIRRLLLTAGVS